MTGDEAGTWSASLKAMNQGPEALVQRIWEDPQCFDAPRKSGKLLHEHRTRKNVEGSAAVMEEEPCSDKVCATPVDAALVDCLGPCHNSILEDEFTLELTFQGTHRKLNRCGRTSSRYRDSAQGADPERSWSEGSPRD